MIAPPMKAVDPARALGDVGAFVGLHLQAAVEPAGGKAADQGAEDHGMIQSSSGFLIAAGHLEQIGHAVDVLRRDQVFEEDDDAVQPAGGAQAVAGQEERQEEHEPQQQAAQVGMPVILFGPLEEEGSPVAAFGFACSLVTAVISTSFE